MIDSLEGLKNIFYRIGYVSHSGSKKLKIQLLAGKIGNMYCPTCGDSRRMNVERLYPTIDQTYVDQLGLKGFRPFNENHEKLRIKEFDEAITPSLYKYDCLQCSSVFTGIIYGGPSGQALAVFPSREGSLSTLNTPKSVSYYLDQASKSHSVGANSAAIAMYRAALEHLLFQQGFTDGMLGQKINSLVRSINNNSAPKWAYELDSEFLKYVKELGNAAIHSNDGDVDQQKTLDNELIAGVKEFFKILLFLVYELEEKKQGLLESFRTASNVINKE